MNHRTHRKLLIVDGDIGYCFGHGVGDDVHERSSTLLVTGFGDGAVLGLHGLHRADGVLEPVPRGWEIGGPGRVRVDERPPTLRIPRHVPTLPTPATPTTPTTPAVPAQELLDAFRTAAWCPTCSAEVCRCWVGGWT